MYYALKSLKSLKSLTSLSLSLMSLSLFLMSLLLSACDEVSPTTPAQGALSVDVISSSPSSLSREGWFAWRLNGGPLRYNTSIAPLSPWLKRSEALGCIERVREGDLLEIITLEGVTRGCEAKMKRLSARARLAFGLKLNPNKASAQELRLIKGVGVRLASALVEGRPWRELSELTRLKGVGVKTSQKLKRSLSLSPARVLWRAAGRAKDQEGLK